MPHIEKGVNEVDKKRESLPENILTFVLFEEFVIEVGEEGDASPETVLTFAPF